MVLCSDVFVEVPVILCGGLSKHEFFYTTAWLGWTIDRAHTLTAVGGKTMLWLSSQGGVWSPHCGQFIGTCNAVVATHVTTATEVGFELLQETVGLVNFIGDIGSKVDFLRRIRWKPLSSEVK